MKAGIITIGDELLIGQTLNTNLAWLGQKLSQNGISILKSCTIRDDASEIKTTLRSFLKQVDLVIITGGLGPTRDDITKETLADFFDTELVMNDRVKKKMEKLFADKPEGVIALNREQAMLPKHALILENKLGTAPGMWFEKNNKITISIPGVPYEMKGIMEAQVFPLLHERFELKEVYFQTLMIQGIGESSLAKKIENWENKVRNEGLHLAYLPSPGLIRLRLGSENGPEDKVRIEPRLLELEQLIPTYAFGRNGDTIFQVVGKILEQKNKTVGTVESCTGGGIANAFVQNAGSSAYFQGGLITYSNALKEELANVSAESLQKFGAVSKQVAIEMAEGGKKVLGVDYCIAVTGIAGPDGWDKEKPVGTVWIAVATPLQTVVQLFNFGKNRLRNIEKTKLYSVNLLRKILLDIQ